MDDEDFRTAFIKELMGHGNHYEVILRDPASPLTVADLEAMKPDTIFQVGETTIEHPWFNQAQILEADGRSVKVKYVVLRGWDSDWKIYHSLDANLEPSDYLDGTTHLQASWDEICSMGAGLHNREAVQRIVPCTEDALERYRD